MADWLVGRLWYVNKVIEKSQRFAFVLSGTLHPSHLICFWETGFLIAAKLGHVNKNQM